MSSLPLETDPDYMLAYEMVQYRETLVSAGLEDFLKIGLCSTSISLLRVQIVLSDGQPLIRELAAARRW